LEQQKLEFFGRFARSLNYSLWQSTATGKIEGRQTPGKKRRCLGRETSCGVPELRQQWNCFELFRTVANSENDNDRATTPGIGQRAKNGCACLVIDVQV